MPFVTGIQRWRPWSEVQQRGQEQAEGGHSHARASQDCYASVFSSACLLVYTLASLKEGQAVSASTWLNAAGCITCLVAHWVLGGRQYAALRTLPAAAARLLFVHSAVLHHACGPRVELFSHEGPAWPRFLWLLALESATVAQLWASLAWQLPLKQHLVVALVTAADFLAFLPGLCRGAGFGEGAGAWLQGCAVTVAAQGDDAAAMQTPFLFDHAADKFQTLTDLLDWPFAYIGKGRLEDLHPVSAGALCAGLLVWIHLALGVVGSSLVIYLLECRAGLQNGQRPQAGRGAPAGQVEQHDLEVEQLQEGQQGVRGVNLLLPNGSVKEAVISALFFAQMLWCVVRVLCIRLL